MKQKINRYQMEYQGISFVIIEKTEVVAEIEKNQIEQVDFDEYLEKYSSKDPLVKRLAKSLKTSVIPYVCFIGAMLGIYGFLSGF